METSDMLDVIHVFFEEDMLPTWEHGPEVKSKMRTSLYRSMYGTEYKYGFSSSQGRNAEWDYSDPSDTGNPDTKVVKPYIPPSTEEELRDILGPAMGE
jgi:hypothetical protein